MLNMSRNVSELKDNKTIVKKKRKQFHKQLNSFLANIAKDTPEKFNFA